MHILFYGVLSIWREVTPSPNSKESYSPSLVISLHLQAHILYTAKKKKCLKLTFVIPDGILINLQHGRKRKTLECWEMYDLLVNRKLWTWSTLVNTQAFLHLQCILKLLLATWIQNSKFPLYFIIIHMHKKICGIFRQRKMPNKFWIMSSTYNIIW